MRLIIAAAITLVAAATWYWLVPHIIIDDPEAPDFAALVNLRSLLTVAAVALAASCVLWLTEPVSWWLWVPYLALGAPLIAVDAATTFLPLKLHYFALFAMALSSIGLAAATTLAWVCALLCGLGIFAFFYLVWRFNPTLGFGDVRLAGLIGAVAGQGGLTVALSAVLAGTVLGAMHGIAHNLWARRKADRPRHFPYGPALWCGPILVTALSAG